MEAGTYIALSRQAGLRREMSVVANNMANLQTPGYRGEKLMFVEYLADTQRGKTGEMSFTQDISTIRDLKPGPMQATDNPLDLALDGDAFFAVETAEGERFTRRGDFQLDGEGRIVTSAGDPLLDVNGNPIQLPADAAHVEVTQDGVVATEQGRVAQIRLAAFDNPQELMKRPGSLFEPRAEQAVLEAEDTTVQQGMLEGSNVNGIIEMTRLIDVSRSYQSAGKFSESEHERILRAVRSLVSSQ
jgi:flagellar basal-body rod protein FlgF